MDIYNTYELRMMRENLGLTQKRVADFLGVTLPTFIKNEKDVYTTPLKRYVDWVFYLRESYKIQYPHAGITSQELHGRNQ